METTQQVAFSRWDPYLALWSMGAQASWRELQNTREMATSEDPYIIYDPKSFIWDMQDQPTWWMAGVQPSMFFWALCINPHTKELGFFKVSGDMERDGTFHVSKSEPTLTRCAS